MLSHSWLSIPELHIEQVVVPLGVKRERFLVSSVTWSLLKMRSLHLGLWTQFMCFQFLLVRTGFVYRTQFMLQYSWSPPTSDGMIWSSQDTLSTRGSGVPQGPCSCCVIYSSFLWLLDARDTYFLPNRFSSILGMSVIFGDWLPGLFQLRIRISFPFYLLRNYVLLYW